MNDVARVDFAPTGRRLDDEVAGVGDRLCHPRERLVRQLHAHIVAERRARSFDRGTHPCRACGGLGDREPAVPAPQPDGEHLGASRDPRSRTLLAVERSGDAVELGWYLGPVDVEAHADHERARFGFGE